ncbi:MAG: hypothetical protein EP329_13145 [Deltaproteobacteria bacterium]|nr:MAG: hypothetical protein EP329_13145 [Deltaproteobacteria bacterium]
MPKNKAPKDDKKEKGKKGQEEAGEQPEKKVRFAEPDPNAVVAKLHLLVDLESRHVGLRELASGDVGHTWVSLEWNKPDEVPVTLPGNHSHLLRQGGKYADPMGFWPDLEGVHTPDGVGVGYEENILKSYVQGHMRHPDRGHEGEEKATLTYSLTYKEAQKAIAYADKKAAAQYSVYFYNCTTFARGVVSAAGKSAPSMAKAGIALPDAAYDGIRKYKVNAEKGESKEMTGGENAEDLVNQAYIGVKFQQVALSQKLQAFLEKPNVLQVVGFEESSPAKAQLAIGDKVVFFNGHRSNSEATIRRGLFGKVNQDVDVYILKEDIAARVEQLDIPTLRDYLKNRPDDIVAALVEQKQVSAIRPPGKESKKKKSKEKGGKKKAA